MIDLKKSISELCSIAKQLGNEDLLQIALFLRQRIHQPDSYVVVLGESCSGKSTIINSMISRGILPTSSVPSTGAITEVFVDETAANDSYAVINRNATMEMLEYPVFCEMALKPDREVQRLRAVITSSGFEFPGIRLFDTPGYGSLIKEHDEVLIDFLPNCDSVLYTVGYKNGIQESDHEFLRNLKELTRPGIPIYLVINRCPKGVSPADRRIAEIYRAVKALLTVQELPLYMIPSSMVRHDMFSTPVLDELKSRIVCDLNSPARREDLYLAFLSYLDNLIVLLQAEIERQIRNLEMSAEDAAFVKRETEAFSADLRRAIEKIIRPGFARINSGLPKCIASSRDHIERAVCDEINKQSSAKMNEMITYTQSHLLPYLARKETEEIQHYLAVELEAIDKEVNNYLNTAVIRFERDIRLRLSSSTYIAGNKMVKDAASRLLNTNLLQYFAKFGGAGGAGAGMANAASHALKQAGDFFGKTFSRETHNSIKHLMKKIGLTSTKTLSAIVSGLIEIASIIYEYETWKPKLISQVGIGLDTWQSETLSLIQSDMDKLEAENIAKINDIIKTYEDAFAVDEQPTGDMNHLQNLLESLCAVEKEIQI